MIDLIENDENQSGAERSMVIAQYAHSISTDMPVLHELKQLARSAGAQICSQAVFRRRRPVAATFIGKGNAEEIAEIVQQQNITLAIFDHPIQPNQERNLEKILCCRVLDRTSLILDIFSQRAASGEGKLQVELAQLKHLSTRLVRGWSHLERQKGGIGLRGPGETQLETDRRLIGVRIKLLSRRLEKVEKQRILQRRARRRASIPVVSIVGYTNAGKSLLFNRLTDSGTHTANRLFDTLNTTMRRIEIPGFGAAVLSDTVGFIRELPHTLVTAFHATLEEVVNSSCLLLVNDYADSEFIEYRATVEKVLNEIGASDVPVIHVNNKIDKTDTPAGVRHDPDGLVKTIWLSAQTGEGVDLLQQGLADLLGHHRKDYTLYLEPHAGALKAMLYQRCEVFDEKIDESGLICLNLKMDEVDRGWLEAQSQFTGTWSDAEPDKHPTDIDD